MPKKDKISEKNKSQKGTVPGNSGISPPTSRPVRSNSPSRAGSQSPKRPTSPVTRRIDKEIQKEVKMLGRISEHCIRKDRITKRTRDKMQEVNSHLGQLSNAMHFFEQYNEFTTVNSNLPQDKTRTVNGTPLIWAIKTQNTDTIEYLLDQPELMIDARDPMGRTAAWWAAHFCQPELLNKLVKRGADLTIRDTGEVTPFNEAMNKGVFSLVADVVGGITGYSMHVKEEYGNPIFHAMASTKQPMTKPKILKMIQTLIGLGLDINGVNKSGLTPLMVAMENNDLDMVDCLLHCGANPGILDKARETFLEYGNQQSSDEFKKILRKNGLSTNTLNTISEVKNFGHILGIGTFLKLGYHLGYGGIVNVPMDRKGKTIIPVYTEQTSSQHGFSMAQEVALKFQEKTKSRDFAMITKAYKRKEKLYENTDSFHKFNQKLDSSFNKYKNGELIIIDPSFPGHGIGMAIYKDKLIYTDRFPFTGGKVTKCTKVFQLDEKINKTMFKHLLKLSVYSTDQQSLNDLLSAVVDLKKPIAQFGDPMQAHGTCVYSNPRSNIEGILTVLYADKENLKTATTNTQKNNIPQENIIQAIEPAHNDYRAFLYDSRTTKIKELARKLNSLHAKKKTPLVNMYLDIAHGYIQGHKNKNKNDGNDWDNVGYLLTSLNPALRDELLERSFSRTERSFIYRELKQRVKNNLGKKESKVTIKRKM